MTVSRSVTGVATFNHPLRFPRQAASHFAAFARVGAAQRPSNVASARHGAARASCNPAQPYWQLSGAPLLMVLSFPDRTHPPALPAPLLGVSLPQNPPLSANLKRGYIAMPQRSLLQFGSSFATLAVLPPRAPPPGYSGGAIRQISHSSPLASVFPAASLHPTASFGCSSWPKSSPANLTQPSASPGMAV